MRLSLVLLLAVLFPGRSHHVYALDCTKVSSPGEKLLCATAESKKADDAMSAAYFKLLRETKDPDFHEALIRSQRRWLKIRSLGPDRFGAAQDDKTDDRIIMLKMTLARMSFLQTAGPIRAMEKQREAASKDSGGSFAGYKSYCVLQPPPYGGWTYECWGEVHRRHNDRICSLSMEWASGHMIDHRFVSILQNGKLKPVASCSVGYADTSEQCPDPDNDAKSKEAAHWSTDSKPWILPSNDLWKYDPDMEPFIADQPWMRECLFSSSYPPADMSAPTPAH